VNRFTISANRFAQYGACHCGTLINIGLHKITLNFSAFIESKNRDKAGFSVPAWFIFNQNRMCQLPGCKLTHYAYKIRL
jgi:hypothetical protein